MRFWIHFVEGINQSSTDNASACVVHYDTGHLDIGGIRQFQRQKSLLVPCAVSWHDPFSFPIDAIHLPQASLEPVVLPDYAVGRTTTIQSHDLDMGRAFAQDALPASG